MSEPKYDAILIVSFGGPERMDDVIPFLENITRGKNVPPERLAAVARRYEMFDGVSPVGDAMRWLLTAIISELDQAGIGLPVYWGNRYWYPMIDEAIEQMAEDGVTRALALLTSAYCSDASCGGYVDAIQAARSARGADAPVVDKIRPFYNHPGFIEAQVERVIQACEQLPESVQDEATLLFTAHSLPVDMAQRSGYREQVEEASRLVAERLDAADWSVAYQSRTGPPSQPWLEPDLATVIKDLATKDRPVILVPIGFVMEHMETAWDLDVEAAELCDQLDLPMVRALTVAGMPRFTRMVRELIEERLDPERERDVVGRHEPMPDECSRENCRRDE